MKNNGIDFEEIITCTDIDSNLALGNHIAELVSFNGEKVNHSCEGVEVDLILKDQLRHRDNSYGGRSDWIVHNATSNQVRWTRNNIAATMERFEPTGHPHPTSLDYGLADTVVASINEETNAVKILNPPNRSSIDIESLGAVGPANHVYSYANYEPSVNCVSNISQKQLREKCKNEQIHFEQNLLPKGLYSKASSEQNGFLPIRDRHTYTTHYGTTENLYEEVSEKNIRKVLSDNRVSITANCVKEELLRVQHNHFRVLEELNLSLEALIMPPNLTSKNIEERAESIVHCRGVGTGFASAVVTSNKMLPQKRRKFGLLVRDSSTLSGHRNKPAFSSTSLEDVSETFQSVDCKDNFQNSSNKDELDEEDLDSGFSGSGISSGASYNESLRYYKTSSTSKTQNNLFSKNLYCSPPPSFVFTTKNNMTSQQATSAANKQYCFDLNTHHIHSTPVALSTYTKTKTNFLSEKS
uniref:Transcriptional regulator lytR n=1 Tax=Zeugodacus cucurbitae TaxID=28588 RepID=A0A0A1WLN3_ZEUCU